MNSTRFHAPKWVAALLLKAIVVLLAVAPARGADTFRLDRVATVRFSSGDDGKLRRQEGVLHLNGRFDARPAIEVARPVNTPDWALNRDLIPIGAWHTYRALGFGATSNFTLFGGAWFWLGDEQCFLIGPDVDAGTAGGRLINISTRARVTAAGDPIIAGFVIEEQPRIVLVRAVGHGLAKFGVSSPAADPMLIIRRSNQIVHTNDNWSNADEASAIRAASLRMGAFALDEGSRDAARIVVLEPGAYTVEVALAGPGVLGGDVLIEIYSVPDDAVELPATTP